MEKGILLLSLDFELFWGVQDGHTYDDNGSNAQKFVLKKVD
mgnify:CR=1 FL=1